MALVLSGLLQATPRADIREVALPPPGGPAWSQLTFAKISRTTVYSRVEVDGRDAVRAESDCSASALYLPIAAVDLGATPRLGWQWRVAQGLEPRDERTKAGDDFAARVYLMFDPEPGSLSVVARLRRRLASALYGRRLPGSAVTYVWSSRLPAGTTWDSPYTPDSKMVALGGDPPTAWRREAVDVVADYRRLFGRTPPRLAAIVVMSDSDDTCGRATAYFADFRLLPR